jgi:hypothetical protein
MPAIFSNAITLASAAEGQFVERELAVPAWGFGVGAMAMFLVLLAITYSFRTVAHGR